MGEASPPSKAVANYLTLKACFESGDDSSSECKALEKLMMGPEAGAAMRCLQEKGAPLTKKKWGTKAGDKCFRGDAAAWDALLSAAVTGCPTHFKAPSADVSPPVSKSETNWLLWGGVAVVAGFFLLRKK